MTLIIVMRKAFLVSRKPYHIGRFLFHCQEKARRPSHDSMVGTRMGEGRGGRYPTNHNKSPHFIQYLYERFNMPSSFIILFYLNV